MDLDFFFYELFKVWTFHSKRKKKKIPNGRVGEGGFGEGSVFTKLLCLDLSVDKMQKGKKIHIAQFLNSQVTSFKSQVVKTK